MKKAFEFDEIANGVFFPIYPAIAEQIKERTGITYGRCLDVGSGGGHLGLNMARITNLLVTLFDNNEDALEIADRRIVEWGLEEKVDTLLGDIHQIPLDDGSVSLVISRGSLWFWEDQKRAFEEIYRVLSPGGMAYIGGGFGNPELKNRIDEKMKLRNPDWPDCRKSFTDGNTPEKFTMILNECGIPNFQITDDDKGIWIVIRK